MSTGQSNRPEAIQTPSHTQSSHIDDNERNRRSSSVSSDLSHHLYYEDNDCFFPPTWLGKKPPTQRGIGSNSSVKDMHTGIQT
ncbi:hypothetical protein BO94DRAFT_532749 [Aspergillus sclerotioniger CBS 115572]|uniref:Uncharacterized protein n=1 Tax=Aspergillus sclerotioniger CBS 115572 TaxID=1450535 RepID=A0A317X668_9EURO|nr:hypothetical protein BO94DRAFT_532749 [Aspergillus sclerotioniger CBS 115572]PWY93805.1 hypothetical protein BO94DRAFT_532749 [Aspergillus sclerotioniger CBS 115572]